MFTAILCFVGGIFFAVAFPQPSAMLRASVLKGIDKLRGKIGW
jgi:hypothetical protein